MDTTKEGQPQEPEQQRGSDDMSLEAPMPPIFGNANQADGDDFKVRRLCPSCVPVVVLFRTQALVFLRTKTGRCYGGAPNLAL